MLDLQNLLNLKLRVPQALDIFQRRDNRLSQPMQALLSGDTTGALPVSPLDVSFAPPPPDIIGHALTLPPLPSYTEFIKNIPPEQPMPPPSPIEMRLREVLQRPDVAHGLFQLMIWAPKQAEQILGYLMRFYPRAFPMLEEEMKLQWSERQSALRRQRLASALQEYQQAWGEAATARDEMRRKEQMLYQGALQLIVNTPNIPNILQALVKVAPHISPESYDLLRGFATLRISEILPELPKDAATKVVSDLFNQGWITPHEHRQLLNAIETGQLSREMQADVIDMMMQRLRNQKSIAVSLGLDTSEIDTTLDTLSKLKVAVQQKGLPKELLNAISSQIKSISEDVQRLNTRLLTSVEGAVKNFSQNLERLVNRIITARSTDVPKLANQLINYMPSAVRGKVLQTMKQIDATTLDGRIKMIDAIMQGIDDFRDTLGKLGDLTTIQLYEPQFEMWKGILQEQRDTLERLKKTETEMFNNLDRAIKEVGDAVLSVAEKRAIDARIARARLALQSDWQNFRKRLEQSRDALRREGLNLQKIKTLLSVGLGLARITAQGLGASESSSDLRQWINTFARLGALKESLGRTINEMSMLTFDPTALEGLRQLHTTVTGLLDNVEKYLKGVSDALQGAPTTQQRQEIISKYLQPLLDILGKLEKDIQSEDDMAFVEGLRRTIEAFSGLPTTTGRSPQPQRQTQSPGAQGGVRGTTPTRPQSTPPGGRKGSGQSVKEKAAQTAFY